MHNASRGIDDEPVTESEQKQQIGRIVTLKSDAASSQEMQDDLSELCRSVLQKAESRKLSFKSVGVLLILDNLENVTRSKSLKVHSRNLDQLHSAAKAAMDEALTGTGGRKVRRLGVKLSDLQSSEGQNTMFDFMKG
jgi:DNA polymerase IV (DinB-like DNA polymerase)